MESKTFSDSCLFEISHIDTKIWALVEFSASIKHDLLETKVGQGWRSEGWGVGVLGTELRGMRRHGSSDIGRLLYIVSFRN